MQSTVLATLSHSCRTDGSAVSQTRGGEPDGPTLLETGFQSHQSKPQTSSVSRSQADIEPPKHK